LAKFFRQKNAVFPKSPRKPVLNQKSVSASVSGESFSPYFAGRRGFSLVAIDGGEWREYFIQSIRFRSFSTDRVISFGGWLYPLEKGWMRLA
jgi:hypothetical protein